MKRIFNRASLLLLAISIALSACAPRSPGQLAQSAVSSSKQLYFVVGSEQETIMEQIVKPWCQSQGWDCPYVKKGSVDQAVMLETGNVSAGGQSFDAMWLASSVWLLIGDTHGLLKDAKSMFVSPLVLAGWKHVMDGFGWSGKDVKVLDIINAAEQQKLHVWMTNPAQSNSGATVYLAFLTAIAGNTTGVPLTSDQLKNGDVQAKIQSFVRSLGHTSPSTKDVMDSCVATPDKCDAVFTYEALVVEYNQRLVAQGKEPLVEAYPSDGLAISDAVLGFVPQVAAGDASVKEKENFFQQLQAYLQSPAGIAKLVAVGRRAGSGGMQMDNADPQVFNPAWGIRASVDLQPITYPDAAVIKEALDLYQTQFRTPVDTVYCLDQSGSMGDNGGWAGLTSALGNVFDQQKAETYQLQTHPQDKTTVMFFNSDITYQSPTVNGNDYGQLSQIYNEIQHRSPGGNTNMYICLERALDLFKSQNDVGLRRLIIVMTDGQSNEGAPDTFLARYRGEFDGRVSLVAVGFSNDIDVAQLHGIVDPTQGSLIVTSNVNDPNATFIPDLIEAMRNAIGYK